MTAPRVLVLVPTISPTRVAAAAPWLTALRDPVAGFDVRIVANAASVADHRLGWAAPVIDTGANPGFARSVSAAARAVGTWDWVVLLNDDLRFSPETPGRIRDAIRTADGTGGELIYFDPESLRPLPDPSGVFLSLSLLESVASRLRRTPGDRAVGATYKSFSAVAIRRTAWDRCGGLDERFVFCFEDAYFARRHLEGGGVEPQSIDVGLVHDRSTTTSRHIARVLPAVAFSARTYLRVTGTRALASDLLVLTALSIRLVLLPFASAVPLEHLRGVMSAMSAVLRRCEPPLPDYDRL